MDLKFLVNEEKSESFLTFVPKFSFVNKYTDIDDFNKYEKIEDLFKIDNNQISFEYTFSNLKELKQNVHPNPINEDENKFDKKFAENIQWKEREKIISKRPFKEKKDLGRKKKEYEGLGLHNKFSDDNIRRKIKSLLLKYILIFINETINIIYNGDIGKGIFKKELKTLVQSQISNATIEFNKELLDKTLEEIFSENISGKYRNFPKNNNKLVIQSLIINEEDENKRKYFKKLFNLTFTDCLKQFRGEKKFEELEGFVLFDNINEIQFEYLNKYKDGKEYINQLRHYLKNYENITNAKKGKKKHNNDLVQNN